MYAKGLRHFEDEPVYGATLEDIDLDFVAEYVHRIGYTKTAEEYLRQNKNFVNGDKISTAAILLFGKNPQHFFPRARIRFIRFDGIEAKVGKDMNVIKDVIFEGRILNQVQQAVDYIKIQMKERTYLGKDAVFVTEEEYGEFVRTEIVVNAATHRDYAIMGTDIQIKMFDDRLEVDSPGSFAGMVKKENIRYTHFSRNPKIAAFLKDYGFVKEYGEGVDRMCRELNAIGLPDPVFDNNTFILKTIICSAAYEKLPIGQTKVTDSEEKLPIGQPKVTDSGEKLPIGQPKVTDSGEKLLIEHAKVTDSEEDIIIDMVSYTKILRLCTEMNYNQPTINNIKQLYEDIELNQIFNVSYISKVLSCSTSTARKLIAKLRDMDVVVPVKGKGKGQYRFKYKSEM
jgi:ATP-dependent DNA helicase RecG